MKIYIRDSIAGNIIEEVATIEEAEKTINEYETSDIADGIFEPDFYEIHITE